MLIVYFSCWYKLVQEGQSCKSSAVLYRNSETKSGPTEYNTAHYWDIYMYNCITILLKVLLLNIKGDVFREAEVKQTN